MDISRFFSTCFFSLIMCELLAAGRVCALGHVLFLGDSDIEFWNTDKFIRGSFNAGVKGETCAE
jgi:hypothetical protein